MNDSRSVWCGNLSPKVTEELLYELFLQVAPIENVRIPTDKGGNKMNYAFITFKHEISTEYALQLLNGTRLFEKNISIKYRNNKSQNEPNTPQNGLRSSNPIPNLPALPGSNFHNGPRSRQWSHRCPERDDRYQDRHSPYERTDKHANRNDSRGRRQYTDLRRDLVEKRRNRNWY